VELVRAGFERAGLRARVEPFIEDMGEEMRSANVIVCRAGSTTLAELAAVGRAALLVPLPTAADDHQRANARALAGAGAAEVLDERDLSGPTLAARLVALVEDDDRRRRMASAVTRFARPEAARIIVDRVLALVERRG
jgi:UDP-N-acetylglucosamine--N-acetylmuramyl-(pentapeptide) pyrophosphoryl-undecaprenol N-acetylglucosamine transferase